MQQQAIKPLTQEEIWHMKKNGDTRGPNQMHKLVAQGIDPRADSPAFIQVKPESTDSTATPASAPAQDLKPAASQGSGPALLSEQQAQVLRSVMGGQARTSAPQPQAGGDFIALVNAHQQHHGCKRSEAIGAVATENPELHRQWLQAQQSGNPDPKAEAPQPTEHQFWTEARQYSAQHGVSMSRAMGEVARQKPQLHAQFLQEVNA